MLPTEVTSKRRSSPWIKVFVGVVALFSILLAVVLSLNRAETARWNRYADSIRRTSGPLSFEEIDAMRRVWPQSPNCMQVIERLGPELGDLGPFWAAPTLASRALDVGSEAARCGA